MARIHNFSAGPAVLPVPVLYRAREALLEYDDSGLGILEMSHRGKVFEAVLASAEARLRRLLSVSDDQAVLFLQGGASSQFFMAPMNLLRGGTAAYLDTGRWSTKAIAEADRFGTVDVVYSSRSSHYDHVPEPGAWGELPKGTVYLHYTSNNTVAGTQFHHVPDPGDAWLLCDASSDICSRPLDASKFDLLYAGAQKNLGPSGVTLVILRKALLERCDPGLPTMLRYGVHVEHDSMYNTPNTWGIFVLDLVCAWIEDQGGLAGVERANRARAERLYTAIDASERYRGLVARDSRSLMNVTFTTGDPDLDTAFWQEAASRGLSGLKGHRSVGGLRASLYNAQTDEAVDALVEFLHHFERVHG